MSAQELFDISSFVLGVMLWIKVKSDIKGNSLAWHSRFMLLILAPSMIFALTGLSNIPQLRDINISGMKSFELYSTIGTYYFVQIYDVFSTLIMITLFIRALKLYFKLRNEYLQKLKEEQEKEKKSDEDKTK